MVLRELVAESCFDVRQVRMQRLGLAVPASCHSGPWVGP